MTSSKKGVSAHQLHRVLEVTYKSAWFLAHRILEAMRDGDLAPFGVGGGYVEADETFIGREPGIEKGKGGYKHKMRSEEHTSELQSLMCISYAVFCLKKKTKQTNTVQKG